MKRILFCIPNLDSRGIPIIWLTKIKNYQILGFETHVLWRSGHANIEKIADVYNFENKKIAQIEGLKPTKSKLEYIFFAIKSTMELRLRFNETIKLGFDYIYTPTSVLDFVIIPSLHKLSRSRVKWVTVFDNTVPLFGFGNKIIRIIAWLAYQVSLQMIKGADAVFTLTPDLKQDLIKSGIKGEKIEVTGCGVEEQFIYKAKKSAGYKLDALYIGRIHPNKGVFDLLKVLSEVIKIYPKFQLGIMGGGDQDTETKFSKQVESMGFSSNVVKLGYLVGEQKYAYLKNTRQFWYFSYDDSFGVSLLEAACMGTEVFAYDLPAFRYIYTNKEIVFARSGDWRVLARQILKHLKKPQMSKQVRNELIERWSWKRIVDTEAGFIQTTIPIK